MKIHLKNIKMISSRLLLVLMASAIISACGTRAEDGETSNSQPIFNANGDLISGGDGSIPTIGEINPLDAVSLRVVSDVNSLLTGGVNVATITAVATNINNNVVADAEVTFRSSAGILRDIESITNENGEATATLALSDNFDNQDIIVTAVNVDAADETEVRVTALGSALTVTGTDTLISGDDVSIFFRLVAGNDEPISFEPLTVVSVNGSELPSGITMTDEDGRAEIVINAVSASDTITASALDGTVSASHSFEVVPDLLAFTNVEQNSELAVLNLETISVNWVSEGSPVQFQPLRFSTTAGVILGADTVSTDASGSASIQLSASSAGPATLTVEGTGVGDPKTNIDVEFIATEPGNIDISASSTLVAVSDSSTLSATVTDVQGNPVKNSRVTFTSDDLKGGQLSPAAATTDSAGVATITFRAGALPTSVDEIMINATVTEPVNAGDPAIERSMNLTVFKPNLNVTLGSNNLVKTLEDGIQYAMPFVVKVTNGSGAAIEDAVVGVSVRPLSYRKGQMRLTDSSLRTEDEVPAGEEFDPVIWSFLSGPSDTETILCDAEDRNGNRFVDTFGSLTEDINGNSQLDPQDPASVAAVDGAEATVANNVLRTDANGAGLFDLAYPASNAFWSYLEISVRAEALGVEATQTFRVSPPLPASELTTVGISPSNRFSPYGGDVAPDSVTVTSVDGETFTTAQGCLSEF